MIFVKKKELFSFTQTHALLEPEALDAFVVGERNLKLGKVDNFIEIANKMKLRDDGVQGQCFTKTE